MIKVSYSALETYSQCSEKYKLMYVNRLTSCKIPSPLFFGSAIDSAVELFLLKKKTILTDKELDLMLTETPLSLFYKSMMEQNGVLLERNIDCEYFLSDFDGSLLKSDDLIYFSTAYPHITDFLEFFESCRATLKNRKTLSDNYQILFNNLCWRSLFRKGEMMLEAYERDVLPEIEEVFDIQKEVHLVNDSGDILRGKIDFIASFYSEPSIKYVVDNKTASEPYKSDSVSTSTQLSIYCEAEKNSRACYIVMEKKMRVKHPRARTQIIKDEISDELKDKTFDIVEEKLNNIARGDFEKKSSPKECFHFGKRCPFYDLCWKNDSTGLKKRE